jgi:hypothetical protein
MRITSTLLLLVSSLISSAQLTEISQSQLSKTKVLSITIMGYTLDEYGAPSKVGSKKEYSKYDAHGNQIKKVSYDAESAVIKNSSFIYKNGVKYKTLSKNKTDKTIFLKSCELNRKNKITSCKGKSKNKAFSYTYQYDKKGKLIKKVKLGDSGEIIHTFEFTYDENSDLIKEKYQGIRKVLTNFSYNATHQLIEKEVYSNDLLSHKTEYQYNKDGDLSQEVKYNSRGLVMEQMRYSYYEKDEIHTIQKFNRTNQLERKWIYAYNDKWNIDTIKIYEGQKSNPLYMSQYLYKYHVVKK